MKIVLLEPVTYDYEDFEEDFHRYMVEEQRVPLISLTQAEEKEYFEEYLENLGYQYNILED